MPTSSETARAIVDLATDRHASDILMLDIREVSSFADYFVLCTCLNLRHLRSVAEDLDTELGRADVAMLRQEGRGDSGWILQDYGDVIVHLFTPEERVRYGLERLWRGAQEVLRIQ